MASAYHPFYDTLWNDDKLEGASFEGKAFFAFLFTNPRVRPSGIYRVTDAQLAADTGLPLARLRGYLADLEIRHLIVRDGAWIFVRGYFKRQPKHDNLVKGVAHSLEECSSDAILGAFSEQYPLYNQRVADRREFMRTNAQKFTTEQLQLQSSYNAVTEHNERLSNRSHSHSDLAQIANSSGNGPTISLAQAALTILVFLNRKANKQFRPTDTNLGFIAARMREGATEDQCRAVIARKVARWKGDAHMDDFLRPKTLFGKTNFAQYLGELPATAFDTPEMPHDT
jgi:uncharacterized phage protein (TIGR02220 family)